MPRAVAQLGSALVWGTRGRRFKSCQPDRKSPGQRRFLCLGLLSFSLTGAHRGSGSEVTRWALGAWVDARSSPNLGGSLVR